MMMTQDEIAAEVRADSEQLIAWSASVAARILYLAAENKLTPDPAPPCRNCRNGGWVRFSIATAKAGELCAWMRLKNIRLLP